MTKRPICENHKFEFKMNRLHVRANQKWIGIGWICLVCGNNTIDKEAIGDKNQKTILEFGKNKVDN